MKLYLAGPLFTPYERQFISDQAQILRQNGIDVFVPHEQVISPPVSVGEVFKVDYAGLHSAHAVLALLDGSQVDDGTACEIGIFYSLYRLDPARKRGVVGYMTDARGMRRKELGYGLNLFVLGLIEECGKIYDNFEEVIKHLKGWEADLKGE